MVEVAFNLNGPVKQKHHKELQHKSIQYVIMLHLEKSQHYINAAALKNIHSWLGVIMSSLFNI